MEEYEKVIIEVQEDPRYKPFLTLEEDYRFCMNTERSLGREEGTINIAKKMINKNYNINDISEITDLSIDTINKLKTEK